MFIPTLAGQGTVEQVFVVVFAYLHVFEFVYLLQTALNFQVGEILGEAWDLGMVGTYAQVHIVVNFHYHHGHFDWIILKQGYTFLS